VRRTVHLQASVGAPLAPPFTPHVHNLAPIWSRVVFWWQVRARVRVGGGGRGVPTRACIRTILVLLSLCGCTRAPPSRTACPPYCMQRASKTEMACRIGGGAPAVVGGGVVKGVLCVWFIQSGAGHRRAQQGAPRCRALLAQSTSILWGH